MKPRRGPIRVVAMLRPTAVITGWDSTSPCWR
jgi:hypothetical protein